MKRSIYGIIIALLGITVSVNAQSVWDSTGTTIYYNSGKVGIGTANPTGHFGIYKAGTIGQGNFNNAFLYLTDATKTLGFDPNQIYASNELVLSSGTDHIQLQTNGVNRLRINNSGRVGIGNDAVGIAGTALDQVVIGNGTSAQGVVLYHGGSSSAAYAFADDTGTLSGRLLYDHANDEISIQHGGADKIAVESNLVNIIPDAVFGGDVGIGTTSPLTNMHIKQSSTGAPTLLIQRKGYVGGSGGEEGAELGSLLFKNDHTNDYGAMIKGVIGSNGWASAGALDFYTSTNVGYNFAMRINNDGNVGIGTATPGNKLEVNGTARAKEVIVEATGWPDYVFSPEYTLLSLEEIEAYIEANGHLPEVPSAEEVEEEGQYLGEMQQLLLKKIEELTLHTINQEKVIATQQELLTKQQELINQITSRLERLESKN